MACESEAVNKSSADKVQALQEGVFVVISKLRLDNSARVD